ncbi:MAG: response regulator [Actinobacteria bacterium]|nr:response regulator [Actinomycetota bacterium]
MGVGAALPAFLGEDDPGKPPERQRPPKLLLVGSDETGRGKAKSLSVLVVEDDPAMRLLIVFNLTVSGFRVAEAATGEEGLRAARGESFDLVLLDVMLPDLGGFQVADRLRADESTRSVPVVFISARTSKADLARGRAVGAIDYVTKPFDPVRLATRLREDMDELERGGPASVWELRFGPNDG